MDGAVGVDAVLNGRGMAFSDVSLELDLQNTAIALPADLWDKPAGEPATASLAASVSGEGAIRLDAQTFYEKASRLAQVMTARYPQGSVISFMLPNWHETAIIYMAATMAGMIAHPILPSLREHDLGFMLKDVASKMIFIPQTFRKHQYAGMLATVIGKLEQPPEVVVVRGDNHQHTAYDSLFTEAPDSEAPPIAATQALPKVDANSVRMIMYTSGTTGNPKGVMLSQRNLIVSATHLVEMEGMREDEEILAYLPLAWVGDQIYSMGEGHVAGFTVN